MGTKTEQIPCRHFPACQKSTLQIHWRPIAPIPRQFFTDKLVQDQQVLSRGITQETRTEADLRTRRIGTALRSSSS